LKKDHNRTSFKEITSSKSSIHFQSNHISFINTLFRDVYSYSYCATNISDKPLEITLDFTKQSRNLIYVPSSGKVTKVLDPGETKFMIHLIADPDEASFAKKCYISFKTL
jgi:hypothetical protein